MTVRRVLEQARVDRAVAVLVLTPSDTENLEAAMLAHEMNPSGADRHEESPTRGSRAGWTRYCGTRSARRCG
jgi:hypothetical protein